MSALVGQGLFWLLAALAIAGALFVLLVRDVMRMALGLGAFMLAIAGFFAYYGFGFLAVAELFVYVGGVLILFLFAIMLVHRGEGGRPTLESRMDWLSFSASGVISVMLFVMLYPLAGLMTHGASAGSTEDLSKLLLGPMLPQFEAVGALLLAALVGVVVVMGGERQ